MAVLCVVSLLGLAFDRETMINAPIWLKPFKFSVAVGLYALTLAWLLSLLPRARRTGWWLGTGFAVALGMDVGLLVWQIIFRDEPLHFNRATATDRAINSVVAGGAYAAWLIVAGVVVLLLFQRLADRALVSALRWGTLLSLAGMSVAMLMFAPTPAQQAVFKAGSKPSMVGGHTVGGEDGGPGLPVTGWSTVHGDLRNPHFIGIHALQALPLVALGLAALAKRYPMLGSDLVRRRLVRTTALGYGGMLALLTWQALRGQSVVRPDFWTLVATSVLILAVVTSGLLSVRARETRGSTAVLPRLG
jgi:hypothetical protein